MRPLLDALPYLAAATAFGIAGGIASLAWKPSRVARSHLQHFATGLVVGAVAVEVIPGVERMNASPPLVLMGFVAGGAVMLGFQWFTHRAEREGTEPRGLSLGLAGAVAFDTLVDGMTVGAGATSEPIAGLVLAIALGVEVGFLTLSVGSEMASGGASRTATMGTATAIALMLLVGGVASALLLAENTTARAVALSFGAAALLYLVTEELLIEAHENAETITGTALLFLGFLTVLAVRLVGG